MRMSAPIDIPRTVEEHSAQLLDLLDVATVTDAKLSRLTRHVDQIAKDVSGIKAVQEEHTAQISDVLSKLDTIISLLKK